MATPTPEVMKETAELVEDTADRAIEVIAAKLREGHLSKLHPEDVKPDDARLAGMCRFTACLALLNYVCDAAVSEQQGPFHDRAGVMEAWKHVRQSIERGQMPAGFFVQLG